MNCDGALSQARREAVPAAAKTADDLAAALGLERGPVINALENAPTNYLTFQLSGADFKVCSNPADDYGSLFPFDAEPEVKVSVDLQVTYLINSTTAGSAAN